MEITIEKRNRNLIVAINGDIDHHTSEEIRTKLDKEYTRSSAKNIIFDFSKVDFMDSSGIGMVIARYKNATQSGGKVGICAVSSSVDRIFMMSGIYKIIQKYDSMEDALKEMEGVKI